MSRNAGLLQPELQKLIDDFVSVRQRLASLAETYVNQQILLERQKTELENAKKEITAMRQIQTQNAHLTKSYDQLKRDYELMYSSTEAQRDEIRAENQKRVCDLEEELKVARAQWSRDAESHEKRVVQIITDYEAKLRDADEKIRQLTRSRDELAQRNVANMDEVESSLFGTSHNVQDDANQRWPKLAVQITARGTAGRGRPRGRPRGAASKRKLYTSNNDMLTDVF